MTKSQVLAFLRIPAKDVVDLAIGMANLGSRERLAIDLCARQGMTRQEAAEEAYVSVDAIQKWYASGMTKLSKAWDGCWWILKLID